MNEVAEAEGLPDRHLYADEEEGEDDVPDEVSDVEDMPSNSKKSPRSLQGFSAPLVTSAKVFGELVLIKTGDTRLIATCAI